MCGCAKSKSENALVSNNQSAEPELISVQSSFLKPLGIAPVLGRDFVPEDFEKSSAEVAIISAEVSASAFASRPNAIGQRLRVGQREVVVVGIAPAHPAAVEGKKVWVAQRK